VTVPNVDTATDAVSNTASTTTTTTTSATTSVVDEPNVTIAIASDT
jgi:hypothetical protein